MADGFSVVNIIYIIVAVISLISVIIIFCVIWPLIKRSKCCKRDEVSTTDSPVSEGPNSQKPSVNYNRNYAVLEDHLDLIDSPSQSFNVNLARPITAAALFRNRPKPETPGIILEFLPDDNTILQIEGTNNRICKITKTKIKLEEVLRKAQGYSIHKGILDSTPVSVYSLTLNQSNFDTVKKMIMNMDEKVRMLTPHPRFVRYLGTCFNSRQLEAYVITDLVAGATIQEMWESSDVREAMGMTEDEKIQAAADIADGIYFLHGHSQPIPHGSINLSSVIIDGETHRAKLLSNETLQRIDEILRFNVEWALNNSSRYDFNLNCKSPELIKDENAFPSVKSDIWSLGCTILQFLFDQPTWDFKTLTKQFAVMDPKSALKEAMVVQVGPPILNTLRTANAKLHFLQTCLQFNPQERSAATYLSKGLQQCVLEVRKESKTPNSSISSFIFPKKRIINSARMRKFDPLIKQQVEWNVKQDAGSKKRALLFGIRNYLGNDFQSLSVTPTNDIKDMTMLLMAGGFSVGNTYENIQSRHQFEDILKVYVDAVNREPEEIDILVVYFAGRGVQGLPNKLAKKRRLGIFLDRVGISHDLALVTSNETLFPVAKMQSILATLNSKVKRKVIILDCRLNNKRVGQVSAIKRESGQQLIKGENLFTLKDQNNLRYCIGKLTELSDYNGQSLIKCYREFYRILEVAEYSFETVKNNIGKISSLEIITKDIICNNLKDKNIRPITATSNPFSLDALDALSINESSFDWGVPVIAEESLDKLTTMFTIYPNVQNGVSPAAVDSHPKRTNGFMTGCLISILRDYAKTTVEDLPKLLNEEMIMESSRAKAFQGIECQADFIPVENDIWMMNLLTKA